MTTPTGPRPEPRTKRDEMLSLADSFVGVKLTRSDLLTISGALTTEMATLMNAGYRSDYRQVKAVRTKVDAALSEQWDGMVGGSSDR